ncbi:hypothetical protein [Actinocatenispora rupis]|uniref:Uncharacterized protein n=1 Tax=Actinocatenispora rupis TaxID=519421 RepID=A0A8J3J690_9ACTN|nr:hypothetical protein [Actinocatenispora rupis]GID14888.1 hypothetical protein Aru02nite_57770 [Actinocatenispora rupis]
MAHQHPHRTGAGRYPNLAALGHVVLAAGMLCTGLTACSSPDRGHAADPTPSASRPSPTQSVTARAKAEREALVAYRGMWNAFVHASRTSDVRDPLIARYTAGKARKTITDSLARDKAAMQVSKGNVVLKPTVTGAKPAMTPAEVDVQDCADASHWLVYHAEGGLIDDEPGGKHLVVAVVENVPGLGWRVTDFAAHEVGSCT